MARGSKGVLGLDIGSWAIKAVAVRGAGFTENEAGERVPRIELIGLPGVAMTPPGCVEGGEVISDEVSGNGDGSSKKPPTGISLVAGTVSSLVRSLSMAAKPTVASVGGETSVVVRITEVSRMTGKELKEAVEWEIERQTPFPVDDAITSWVPIEPPDGDPDSPNMEVLLVVAQKELVSGHVQVVQSAGLSPEAIDVEPLAISRALVDLPGGSMKDQTIAIVHMGASSTLILVVRKGLLSFVRSVGTGGKALSDSVKQNIVGEDKASEWTKHALADFTDAAYMDPGGVGAEGQYEADDDLFAEDGGDSVFEESSLDADLDAGSQPVDMQGAATQIDVPLPGEVELPPQSSGSSATAGEPMDPQETEARSIVYEALAPQVVDLATEIRRSIDFYRRQHRNEEIDRIILSGGSAVMPGLTEFVQGETGVTTQLANPFAHFSLSDDAPREYLTDIGPAMVVAVGLAVRDIVE